MRCPLPVYFLLSEDIRPPRGIELVHRHAGLPSQSVTRYSHHYSACPDCCQHPVVVIGDGRHPPRAVRGQPSGGVITQRVCAALPDAGPPVIYLSTRAKSERLIKGSGVT